MAAPPNEPHIQDTARVNYPPAQPPARIIPNEPAATLAQALANGKRQVDAAK